MTVVAMRFPGCSTSCLNPLHRWRAAAEGIASSVQSQRPRCAGTVRRTSAHPVPDRARTAAAPGLCRGPIAQHGQVAGRDVIDPSTASSSPTKPSTMTDSAVTSMGLACSRAPSWHDSAARWPSAGNPRIAPGPDGHCRCPHRRRSTPPSGMAHAGAHANRYRRPAQAPQMSRAQDCAYAAAQAEQRRAMGWVHHRQVGVREVSIHRIQGGHGHRRQP